MQLRDYQQRAVNFLQNKHRGFIVSPAGSGKTIMAGLLIKELIARVDKQEPPMAVEVEDGKVTVTKGNDTTTMRS